MRTKIFTKIISISFYIGTNVIGIPELFELCRLAEYKIKTTNKF